LARHELRPSLLEGGQGRGSAPARLTPSLRQREALDAVESARDHLLSAGAELASAVALARRFGSSSSELGRALDVTRQAAQQRFRSAVKGVIGRIATLRHGEFQ
jgi:hypothetical protein